MREAEKDVGNESHIRRESTREVINQNAILDDGSASADWMMKIQAAKSEFG